MFLQIPDLKIGKNGEWILVNALIYEDNGEAIMVPAGFPTDLASIPRIFTPMIPQNGKHRAAAILHDYLYFKRGIVGHWVYSRGECDEIFLRAMKELGVKAWRRWAMYSAVRVGGWKAWYG